MSSTCVLSPNPFSNSVTASNSPNMARELLGQHPALRGWTASPVINADHHLVEENYDPTANEIMRGSVTLLSSSHGPQRVVLSVTRTSVDHFALVYADNRRKIQSVKPVGCINLRGVNCEETVLGNGIIGFTLRPKKCDTSLSSLIFLCQEIHLLPKWIESLSPSSGNGGGGNWRNIPKKCSLPCLTEEEE